MATIEKITNANGEEEIIIYDIVSLRDLVDTIYEQRNGIYDGTKLFIIEEINFSKETISYKIDFTDCVFEKRVFLQDLTFEKNVMFENTIFNNNTYFNKCKFKGNNVSFVFTHFNKEVSFEDIEFHSKSIGFASSHFNDRVSFNNSFFGGDESCIRYSTFENNVSFQHCKFYYSIDFENTTFNKLVDFYKAVFSAPQQFHLTDFLDRAIFSDAVFKEEAQFIHCKVNNSSIINFHSTTFEKGLDISRSNFNLCKMSFWDIKINGIDNALSSKDYKNNFGEEEYPPTTSKKLRESMRFIKHSFYAENNKIEGLEFYKKEMGLYRKEIEKGNLEDKIILWFNHWSNNFETDWIIGVLFTILVGLITFSFIFITLSCCETISLESEKAFPDFLQNLGEIMNVTKWTQLKIYGLDVTGWSYVWLFLGRIFIGYGYYQTIQAFRKYGKS